MTVFGFKLGKKHIIVIVVIVLVIILVNFISKQSQKKELEERREQIEKEQQAQNSNTDPSAGLSQAELQQLALIEEFGTPPEGFRWNTRGELVAVSSDDLTSEEVLWNYLRALSILDFSTVEKYSYISMVDSTYLSYFNVSSIGNASYYKQFLRKAYKFALTTLEVEEVGDIAVFSDGSCIATVKLKIIDLTDKEFWREDEDEIYKTLANFYMTEEDSTKADQYLYDYIYSAYEDGKVGKREITIDIKLDKVNLGGWLIADDTDLDMALRYDKGVNVSTYIRDCYFDWVRNNDYVPSSSTDDVEIIEQEDNISEDLVDESSTESKN